MTYLTIESEEIDKIKKGLNLKMISKQNNSIKFINNLSPNELIDRLSNYKIDKMLIEEATMEDLFIEFYK